MKTLKQIEKELRISLEIALAIVSAHPEDADRDALVKEIVRKTTKQIKGMVEEIRIPEWHKLSQESQEKLKVMTSYGAYEELRKTINQKLKALTNTKNRKEVKK